MKKAMTLILIAAFLLTAFATTSCRKTEGSAKSETPITSLQTENPDTETDEAAETPESQSAGSAAVTDDCDTEKDEGAEEIFGLFAGSYYFGSGVGFWGTTMTLNGDGTFEGKFHDWDSAPNTDEYEGFECSSVFSGRFKNPQKINDYTYSFEIDHIEYEREPGTEEIVVSENYLGEEVKTKVRYSEAYGLDQGTTTVYAYAVGAPLAELPDSFINWVGLRGSLTKGDDRLTFTGLYAVGPGYGWSGPKG